jgi:hypothetical protein
MLLVLHVVILELAAPAGSTIAPQPVIVVPPSVKRTVPVGALPATVAVNVTLAPTSDGFAELDSVVIVGAGPIVTDADGADGALVPTAFVAVTVKV